MTHISIGVTDNCKNPESYGTICVKCNMCGRFDKPKQTNADRIRAMSDEELAHFITYSDFCETICGSDFVCGGGCEGVMLDWLKQEAYSPELGGES